MDPVHRIIIYARIPLFAIHTIVSIEIGAKLLLEVLFCHLFLIYFAAICERCLNIPVLQLNIIQVLFHLFQLVDLIWWNFCNDTPQTRPFLFILLILVLLKKATSHLLNRTLLVT